MRVSCGETTSKVACEISAFYYFVENSVTLSLVSHTETAYTFYIQKLYKMYTTDACKMYTTFRQAFVWILYTKSKELCQLNFIYKLYTKVCWSVGYILYTNILYTFCIQICQNVGYILYTDILYTFCIQNVYKNLLKYGIHFVYINADLQKVYIINIMYTICTQNLSRIYI